MLTACSTQVQGQLTGKLYGNAFSLDVAAGEPALGPAEVIRGRAGLDFAGVDPPELRVYPGVIERPW